MLPLTISGTQCSRSAQLHQTTTIHQKYIRDTGLSECHLQILQLYEFDTDNKPVSCISCLRAGSLCIIKLGSFHGCFFCKANQRGCSLCPKVEGSSDSPLNVPHKNWCWYLTLVHHIASILEMDTLEGPIAVLPSYEGVQFPRSAGNYCR